MALPSSVYPTYPFDDDDIARKMATEHWGISVSQIARGIGTSAVAGHTLAPSNVAVPQPTISSAMLKSDVFKLPVESLCDVWVARFGDTWVNTDTLEDEEFWRNTYARLKSLGKIETHYLTDQQRYVCRKPS